MKAPTSVPWSKKAALLKFPVFLTSQHSRLVKPNNILGILGRYALAQNLMKINNDPGFGINLSFSWPELNFLSFSLFLVNYLPTAANIGVKHSIG